MTLSRGRSETLLEEQKVRFDMITIFQKVFEKPLDKLLLIQKSSQHFITSLFYWEYVILLPNSPPFLTERGAAQMPRFRSRSGIYNI